jgi:two-component system CitB family sensor kinase
MEREIFRRGVSTKDGGAAGERGIGLSLVHLVCTRRGGDVTATSVGGSTFVARLPADAETLDGALVDA